jgi:hypothetical protein
MMGEIPNSIKVPLKRMQAEKIGSHIPVGGKDDTHPIERVSVLVRLDTVKWDLGTTCTGNSKSTYLTANEVNKQGDRCPQNALLEGNLSAGRSDLGQNAHYRPHQVQESHFNLKSIGSR